MRVVIKSFMILYVVSFISLTFAQSIPDPAIFEPDFTGFCSDCSSNTVNVNQLRDMAAMFYQTYSPIDSSDPNANDPAVIQIDFADDGFYQGIFFRGGDNEVYLSGQDYLVPQISDPLNPTIHDEDNGS